MEEYIKDMVKYVYWNVDRNKIGAEGMRVISKTKWHTTIQVMNLRKNWIMQNRMSCA